MTRLQKTRLGLWALAAGVLVVGGWLAANPSARADSPEGPTGKVQQGLVGGTEVSEKIQETYGLLRLSNDSGTCSASLLRNDWAITAAHCVEQEDAKSNPIPDKARPGQNILMPVGGFKLRGKWGGGQKKKLIRIETFRPYDIAIVQADTPFTVNGKTTGYSRGIFLDQFPYFGTPTGAVITVYGCGINQFAFGSGDSATPSQMDGKYRMGKAKVTYEKDNRYWFPANGGQMIAGGDSGGPSFATVGTSLETVLVGVHSEAQTINVKGKANDPSDQWKWVASTPEAGDAPVKPVWPQIENIIGKFVLPPPPPEPFLGHHSAVFENTVPFDTKTSSDFQILYGVKEDGTLMWHRHLISRSGNTFKHSWNAPKKVGDGWLVGFKNVYPAGMNAMYSLADDGTLRWYWHTGVLDGSYRWREPEHVVGTGWTSFTQIIPMDHGVVYGILPDGTLRWHRHLDYQTGTKGLGGWASAKIVGWGWDSSTKYFSGGNGVIYAVGKDGKLMWYRHKEYLNPPAIPASSDSNAVKLKWQNSWAETKKVGDGWGEFTKLFSPGEGHIYAVLPNGDLMYYRHLGWASGRYVWDESAKAKIASGWDSYVYAFARTFTSDAGSGNPEVDLEQPK